MRSHRLDTTTIQGIPVLTLSPATARRLPAIFFVPGFGGTKEAGLPIGYRLARQGFFFISFDPWLHGERRDRRLNHAPDQEYGGIYPPDSGLDTLLLMFQVIQQCVADMQTLMEHYATDPRVDVDRCGVTGLSMGGCATFSAFADLPQVQAAAPMISLPSFARRWIDIVDECAFSNLEWAAALEQVRDRTREHTAFVQQIDPHDKLKDAAPRALLIMNNDFDTDQPKHFSIDAYRMLLPHYAACAENLKLRIYPAAHVVTPEMQQDAVDWFCQHLMG